MYYIKTSGIRFISALFLGILPCTPSLAQYTFPDAGHVYADSVVPRIDITMDAANLATLYANPLLDDEYPCTFVFNDRHSSDTLTSTGIRIRGNTSRLSAKKSFKLSFNTYVKGRKYNHLEKMNLNGEHNDPSIIRSKLCWDLLREMGVPAPRANHVEFYINGNYYGLYISVEDIDENFVKSRFGNKDGNLYKCLYPADLVYISHDPNAYKVPLNGSSRAYELQINKTTDDYSDLEHFIDVLNNTLVENLPAELEKVFDVNNFLKVIVADVLTGNWDDYIYNKNNMFLYHNTETDQFEYIPYDLDNTFGIDWFGIDWANRNIYAWGPAESRPLFDRIMQFPKYKQQFSYYMKQALAKYFIPSKIDPWIDAKRTQISASAQNDIYRTYDYGYSFNDFLNSYSQALTAHVKYGLEPYIQTRAASAASQLTDTNIAPIISWVHTNQPILNMPFIVSAHIEDDDTLPAVILHYTINDGEEQSESMLDDGAHQDLAAGDLLYATEITSFSEPAKIQYYIEATDKHSNISRAPISGWYQYNVSNFIDGISNVGNLAGELNVYPNPFSKFININIPSGNNDNLILRIYDYTGRLVFMQEIRTGASSIQWNGHDSNGNSLPDGIYLASLKVNSVYSNYRFTTKRILLLK